ncbi:biotin/lipoyl-containing protein, partial [Nocardia sp. CC201C]
SWEDRGACDAAPSAAHAGASPAVANGAVAPVDALSAAAGSDAVVPVQGNGSDVGTFTLDAETVGVFYRAPEPGAAAFVADGDPVRAGQQVGIVEAMKLMIPVTVARAGRVVEFLVGDAEPVEYGQPLIRFEEVR